MKTTSFVPLGALGAVMVLGGCVSSATPSSTDQPAASASDVSAYQALVLDVQSAEETYRTNMYGSAAMTQVGCAAIHDQYDAQLRPLLGTMVSRGSAMDGLMAIHGGASVADVECVAADASAELDHHQQYACQSADVSQNRLEAEHHVDAMLRYAGAMWDRCDELMLGYDQASWDFGHMMDGCGFRGADMMGDCTTGMARMMFQYCAPPSQ